MAVGQILVFPIDFDRRPYNTLALPCECVICDSRLYNELYNTPLDCDPGIWPLLRQS